jgi:uncharacterized hydrophobic protein (TIGR00271 family)
MDIIRSLEHQAGQEHGEEQLTREARGFDDVQRSHQQSHDDKRNRVWHPSAPRHDRHERGDREQDDEGGFHGRLLNVTSPHESGRLANLTRRLQHWAAEAVHIDEAGRADTVVTMLANNARRAPGYWIQLVLATGIATLGLVLNSTAVVIGAMLVSPLMGPLVELGMGFAVGSSLLVMRASLRVLLSVGIAIAAAALITMSLPFQEITAEVSARAAPTLLDLLVAMFCALTAAYTTVRPGSDTTAAAGRRSASRSSRRSAPSDLASAAAPRRSPAARLCSSPPTSQRSSFSPR